ncbi:MAG: biotin-dependent carboxyltransferase family protein [Gemmataceae bacterium]
MTLRVLSPGLHSLVVDGGRPRTRSLGVPVGGAADRFALAVGNALVGNPPDAAALEITLAGPTVVADVTLGCVVFGAPFDLGPHHAGTTFTLRPGDVLKVGGTRAGARAYLCVAGGIDAPAVLGSRTGLRPVAAGDVLPCREGRAAGRSVPPMPQPPFLRVLPGPHAALFPDAGLGDRAYRVSAAADRMGVRFEGPPLSVPGELPSEPACPGAVQVTRDGQCILLGVDGQTIGGYPKVAQVIAADLDAVGQLRPGQAVTFRAVTPAEASSAWQARAAALRGWLTRLGVSA